ncbi:MAG: Alcohol dehydrogenase GroES domain protein [Bryobacterales bacterium]|nr:Alcohol dehydrogenase GroES domain protein [Bryobacterales bacterium]
MIEIHALAASSAKGRLEPFSYDPGPLGDEQVEIEVQYCGICHSDVSMLNNEWGISKYPFVPGHEAIGKVVAAGPDAKSVTAGQTVGLGWNAGSCLHCAQCLDGDHNMCRSLEQTIVERHGAFATRVRCHWLWATPIPDSVDPAKAGPLLCGGITVFNPLLQFDVKPTDHVGVVGIGGLGHMALQFLNKWGCHVTAFTTSDNKADEAKKMGAHAVINTRSQPDLKSAAGSFNLILSTVMAEIDLPGFINALGPKGIFHTVGVLPEVKAPSFPLIVGQKSISGSPSGAPATVIKMLEFAGRHKVEPITESFPMSKANEALAHLEAGKARYRIVLTNDLK